MEREPGKRKIGAITIGQSPRVDVVPEMTEVLGPSVEVVEGGALDGLSAAEVAALAPRDGDYVLVTRMRDGSSVKLAEHQILPRMQDQVDRLVGEGVEAVALLCTGEFPAFRSPRLMLEPQRLLHHFVAGVAGGRRLGVVVPIPEQIGQGTRRWEGVTDAVRVEAGSPYADIAELERAVGALREWRPDLVVLDCMGFDGAMKARAAAIAGVPVILPRTVLARTLAELL
jgi:protein AroM